MHPNMVEIKEDEDEGNAARKFGNPYDSIAFESDEESEKRKRGCCYYFRMLDNRILRPVFIYKYNAVVKKQKPINFEEMLEEYKQIQEELAKIEDDTEGSSSGVQKKAKKNKKGRKQSADEKR